MSIFRECVWLLSVALFTLVPISTGAGRTKISIDIHYELDCGEDIEGCGRNAQNNNASTAAPQSITTPSQIPTTNFAKTSGTSSNTAQKISATTELESTTTTGVPTTTSGIFTCPAKGNFIDPKDCRSYYNCDDPTKPARNTCFMFFRFDTKTSKCEFGGC
ncbi:hypothetical protein C0J52_08345 [Blattella germanica]|nr:hypothetical protein C0J52_08345 [Blattella germanica]